MSINSPARSSCSIEALLGQRPREALEVLATPLEMLQALQAHEVLRGQAALEVLVQEALRALPEDQEEQEASTPLQHVRASVQGAEAE